MRVDSNIYNFLSAGLKPVQRNTTHKSSELKAHYSNMARYNKNSPLYLVSMSTENQSKVINIKEAALTLKDIVQSFSDEGSEVYSTKLLHSSDESAVTGVFRNDSSNSLPDKLTISVNQLAEAQANTGALLPADKRTLAATDYPFSIITALGRNNFSLHVSEDDTNSDILKKLSDLVNSRNIGVSASVLSDDTGMALQLTSGTTGTSRLEGGLCFKACDDNGLCDKLGLNNVTTMPQNSSFEINGEVHESTSNNISVNQVIELDFHKTTDTPVEISLLADSSSAREKLHEFADTYNQLVDISSGTGTILGSRSLMNDIKKIVNGHSDELEQIGLSRTEDGHMAITDEMPTDKLLQIFNSASNFRRAIDTAADKLSLDPIAYINKLIVTYPNPTNKVSNSYNQSVYSGLIYNNYA